jgi:peptide/nickel transport system ATP-binding protein
VALDHGARVLDVRELRVSYHTPAGPVRAVNDVSFFPRPGERFGLVGESGSGKTTTALSLMGCSRSQPSSKAAKCC